VGLRPAQHSTVPRFRDAAVLHSSRSVFVYSLLTFCSNYLA
jgi:hypothetical protein